MAYIRPAAKQMLIRSGVLSFSIFSDLIYWTATVFKKKYPATIIRSTKTKNSSGILSPGAISTFAFPSLSKVLPARIVIAMIHIKNTTTPRVITARGLAIYLQNSNVNCNSSRLKGV